MKRIQFRELSEIDLEATNGGDWLKDVGDYWSGVIDGIKDAFGIRRKQRWTKKWQRVIRV